MGRMKEYYYSILERMSFFNPDEEEVEEEHIKFDHQDNEEGELSKCKKAVKTRGEKQSSSTKP